MRVTENETVVIVADPPWPHTNGSRTNSGKSPKYPLMNLREIAALGPTVVSLAGDNAVLYIWATSPHLPGAIDTVQAWGFKYRSFHVWSKVRVACGFWSRSNAELCIIAERGRPAAPPASMLSTSIIEGSPEASGHSTKQSIVHEMIERLWPEAKKIELFARRRRDGWHSYGGDLGHCINQTGIERAET